LAGGFRAADLGALRLPALCPYGAHPARRPLPLLPPLSLAAFLA